MRRMHMLMAAASALTVLAAAPAARAADPCAGGLAAARIVDCLKPDGLAGATRGIRAPAKSGTTQPPAAAAETQMPTVNLLVPFDLDSAALTVPGRAALDALASALNDPALSGARFQIGGHTDATGTAEHNMVLSQQRAEAALNYLVSHAGIEASRLTAVGFGSTHLYNAAAPDAAINRRVQVSRLGS
ncbi:MAG: hypothetical protein ABS99_05935 [Acetobacteraceae bacterium SCN 69-10]|nr:OmpA family protein [Rhodospirillales bacterium]ODU56405.1 MAG: hypothetical protein ABS99_05935 [Acetobacteraceae bacterium SCN 69-10]OJY74643.1 MAG: hypothetical protein BGP12_06705 [Rhodospirillales bacterium 70-18]